MATDPDAPPGRPVDLRLVPTAAGAWAGAGLAVAHDPATAAMTGTVAALLALVLLAAAAHTARITRGQRVPGVLTALGLVCVGAALATGCTAVHLTVRVAGPTREAVTSGAPVTADVQVVATPRRVRSDRDRAPRWVVRVRAETMGTGTAPDAVVRTPLLLIAPDPWGRVEPGHHYRIRGTIRAADPGDDVVGIVRVRGSPHPSREPSRFVRATTAVRQGLNQAVTTLPADAAGLLPGLVVGDTRGLDPTLEEAMRATGLTHLTAVSGANITIVTGTVLWVLRWLRVPRRAAVALAGTGVVGFVLLVGPEPSVLRAAVMGGVGLLALASARPGAAVPALSAAVVVLCAADPWLARAAGFALSVLATAGIVLVARPLASRMPSGVPEPVRLAVTVPLAAQVFCSPVLLLLAPDLPAYAVPANMVVAPAVAPATVLGLVAALVAPWAPGPAGWIAWPAGWPVQWVAVVARFGADLPGALVPWPQGPGGAVLLLGLTAAAGVGVWLMRRPVDPRVLGAVAGVAVLVLGVGWLAGPAVLRLVTGWPVPGWRLVVCDVGQGSAAVVSTGPGSAIVIDTGPQDSGVDGCLRRLGVERIDLLVLTHFHADHVAGLGEVIGRRQIGQVLVSPLPEPADGARAVHTELTGRGLTARVPVAGEQGTVGAARYEVLGPTRVRGGVGDSDGESAAANNASLVLHVRIGDLSAVFLGDAEPPAQLDVERVLVDRPDLVPLDAVVVAHHGSAHQRWALYERLGAPVSLISAGAGNPHGHPAPVVLDTLTPRSTVVRTDTCGDLALTRGNDGTLRVACRSGTPPSGREPVP